MGSAPVPVTRLPRRRSFAGPIVLIVMGIVFLLGNMGVITWNVLGLWFAHYWPLLLILWGVIKLVEYYAARNAGYAASGIGVGGVFLIILIIMVGVAASTASRVAWNEIGGNVNFGDDWSPFYGRSFDFNESMEQAFTPGSTLRINSSHGDIQLNSWNEDKIKVVIDKSVGAESEAEAGKINDRTKPSLTSSGSVMVLTANTYNAPAHGLFGSNPVRVNMDIYLPRKVAVEIDSSHGDIKIAGREGDLKLTTAHGDITLDDITGNVKVAASHGDFTANSIKGDVTLDGHVSDATISDVTGTVTLNGDFFDNVSLAQVANNVRFNSSRTDLQMGALPGDMKMDSGDLTVSSSSGGFTLHTRSKAIRLDNIGGDVEIDNSNDDVELHGGSMPLGNVTIHNDRGGVQVYLPPQFPFQIEAASQGGEIQSDFSSVTVQSTGNTAHASGSNGSASKRVQLTADHGDIEIRNGVSTASVPAPPGPSHGVKAPPLPRAPKTPKAPRSPEPPEPGASKT